MTKRFHVWARCGRGCGNGDDIVLEFKDTDTAESIEADCADTVDTLIGNNFDTGWNEMEPGEKLPEEK